MYCKLIQRQNTAKSPKFKSVLSPEKVSRISPIGLWNSYDVNFCISYLLWKFRVKDIISFPLKILKAKNDFSINSPFMKEVKEFIGKAIKKH